MSDDSSREKTDAIKFFYGLIRAQILATKEQRFRLYNWKALAIFGLFGWYFTNHLPKETEAPSIEVAVFAAIAVMFLAVLFDMSILSRSVAIKRDGELLRGLEKQVKFGCGLVEKSLPENFYADWKKEKLSDKVKEKQFSYFETRNRRLESVAQYLFSLFSICGGGWVVWSCLQSNAVASPIAQVATFVVVIVFGGVDGLICFSSGSKPSEDEEDFKRMHQLKQRVADLVAANLLDDAGLRDEPTIRAWQTDFEEWQTKVLPKENTEPLVLVDSSGQPTGVQAPRWLCHLLALRHAVAHVVLRLKTVEPTMLLLQVRSWSKADSPGHLDITVGGHVKCGANIVDTAFVEMSEETGFELTDLEGHQLRKIHAYPAYNTTGDWFHNNEWCEVYEGDVIPASFTKLRFVDGEVVGLYLCPIGQARDLLIQSDFPIASALKNYLDVGAR